MSSTTPSLSSTGKTVIGALAVLAVLLVVVKCGGAEDAPRAAPPPRDDWVNVEAVLDPATLLLADGRQIRQLGVLVPEPGTCEAEHALREAKSMVEHRSVSLTREPGVVADEFGSQWAYIRYGSNEGGQQRQDYGIALAKKGWVIPHPQSPDSPTYEGYIRNGITAAQNAAAGRFSSFCKPIEQVPIAPSPPASGSRTDVDVDVHRHNMPDGALTGGFCARKWYC